MKRTALSRSTGLVRSKGLVARQPLVRRSPLTRTAMRSKRSPAQRRQDVLRRLAYELVDERSGGRCEMPAFVGRWIDVERQTGDPTRCERLASQHQHRRPRRSGGSTDPATETAANIYGICRECHDWVESHRMVAKSRGWLLPAGADPEASPVLLWCGWVLLDRDGSWRAAA